MNPTLAVIITVPNISYVPEHLRDVDLQSCIDKNLSCITTLEKATGLIYTPSSCCFPAPNPGIGDIMSDITSMLNACESPIPQLHLPLASLVNPYSPDNALNLLTNDLTNTIVSVGQNVFICVTTRLTTDNIIYDIFKHLDKSLSLDMFRVVLENTIPEYKELDIDITIVHYPGIEKDVTHKIDVLPSVGVEYNAFTNHVPPFEGLIELPKEYSLRDLNILCDIKNYELPTIGDFIDSDLSIDYYTWTISDVADEVILFNQHTKDIITPRPLIGFLIPNKCVVKFRKE